MVKMVTTMISDTEDRVNKNLIHKIILTEPYLFAYSQIGVGLKTLYDGAFLDHMMTKREKDFVELNNVFDVFMSNLHISAKNAVKLNIRKKKPLPKISRNISESINAIIPPLRSLIEDGSDSDPLEDIKLLEQDAQKSIKCNAEEILYPLFSLANELALEFNLENKSAEFIRNQPDFSAMQFSFLVENIVETPDDYDSPQFGLGDLQLDQYLEANRLQNDWCITYYFSVHDLGQTLYLAFPIMLMHEFISHIYTSDFQLGEYCIASRSFLEGWMVWAIENFLENRAYLLKSAQGFQQIRFLSERLDAFQKLRYDTYKSSEATHSASIMMGRDTARWFCNHLFNRETFLNISYALLTYPSDPSLFAARLNQFVPLPSTNLHEEFLKRLTHIRRLLDSKNARAVNDKLMEIFAKHPMSLPECWAGIFSEELNSFE